MNKFSTLVFNASKEKVKRTVYSSTARWHHLIVAVPLIGSIGTVLVAQQVPTEDKGKWMWRHKSLGLLTGMVVAPRVAYRIFNREAYNVEKLAGNRLEHLAASVTHYGLYGFMVIMPASGIAMGYFGGKGLPFFYTSFSGITKTPENMASTGAIAGQSFQIHKTLGTYGKFLVPIHVGGAFTHYFKGHAIFSRINPFRRSV